MDKVFKLLLFGTSFPSLCFLLFYFFSSKARYDKFQVITMSRILIPYLTFVIMAYFIYFFKGKSIVMKWHWEFCSIYLKQPQIATSKYCLSFLAFKLHKNISLFLFILFFNKKKKAYRTPALCICRFLYTYVCSCLFITTSSKLFEKVKD